MKLKNGALKRLHKSPAMWSAVGSAICTGASEYLSVFEPVVPETLGWRAGLFSLGIALAVIAAIAPGIFDTSEDQHS
jgi:hypothetical protein